MGVIQVPSHLQRRYSREGGRDGGAAFSPGSGHAGTKRKRKACAPWQRAGQGRCSQAAPLDITCARILQQLQPAPSTRPPEQRSSSNCSRGVHHCCAILPAHLACLPLQRRQVKVVCQRGARQAQRARQLGILRRRGAKVQRRGGGCHVVGRLEDVDFAGCCRGEGERKAGWGGAGRGRVGCGAGSAPHSGGRGSLSCHGREAQPNHPLLSAISSNSGRCRCYCLSCRAIPAPAQCPYTPQPMHELFCQAPTCGSIQNAGQSALPASQ